MRRTNKSSKVPNVKLRPAPPPTRTARLGRHGSNAPYGHSSDSEIPPSASGVDLCPRPFRHFYICATGTMDKSALFKMAVDLGAESTNDFTDRVTHLIADAHGGAKYLCAVERKIPIMTPDWITASHAIWLRGDDVDVEQSVANHRLPVFSGVVLSLSGIDDIQRRTEINRLVTAHQGTYLKNLERPVRVTHLLCSGDVETDKMKYAEKFNKRKEAEIHLVWEEWFWDTLEFGGRFDERKYQVSRPRPEKRKSLQEASASFVIENSAPGSHPRSVVQANDQPKRPKLLAPAGSFTVINNFSFDDDDEEMAAVNRPVPAVTLRLWQSLLKPRGFELDSGKLVRSPSKSQAIGPPSSPSARLGRSGAAGRNGGGAQRGKEMEKECVISSFRRAKSFAPVLANESAVRQPFRRNTTCPSICSAEAEGSGAQLEGISALQALFSGYTFRLLGEARCPNVRLAIENSGGVVMDDDAEEPDFIIVRLISGSKLYREELDDHARTKYRTECWLEHSVFHEQICQPDENVTFTPLRVMTPVSGTEKINLSLSGLDQSQLCWVRRLVRALGVILEPTFSRRSTHLICPCGAGAKFDKASEWRIPVVTLAWLEDIAKTGTIPAVDEYLVGGSTSVAVRGAFGRGQLLDSVPAHQVRKDKGKGKQQDLDCQMMDITNDGLANQPMFIKNAALLENTATQIPDERHHRGRSADPVSPARDVVFGKPLFLAHNSDPPEEGEAHEHGDRLPMSSPPEPPPQSSSPPAAEIVLPPSDPVPPIRVQIRPAREPSSRPRSLVPTQLRTQTPMRTPVHTQARIPSSTSPSPMKLLPSSSVPDAFGPSSSPPPPDTETITRALHESLTSLLGKRPMAEDDAKEAGETKKGKRVRPGGASVPPSRAGSRDSFTSPTRLRPLIAPSAELEMSMGLFDGLGASGEQPTDDSLRVTYEDPRQAEEKRRLLSMLGVDTEAEVPRAGGGARTDGNTCASGTRTRRAKRAKGAAS